MVAILLTVGIAIYFSLDPSGNKWFPKCPFLAATGLKCPGCGSQRAIHALLHAQWTSAWDFNALMVISLPLIALLLLGLMLKKRYPQLNNAVNSLPVIIVVGVTVVAWWIARNVWGW